MPITDNNIIGTQMIPPDARVLSPEQVGRIRGLCDAIRIVGSGNTDIEQLSIAIELELNPSLRALRDLQQQADAEKKAHPAYCIHVELSRAPSASAPGKAPASAKVPRTHTDTPPAPQKRYGMLLKDRVNARPLDVINDIKQYLGDKLSRFTARDIIQSICEDMLFDGQHLTVKQLASLLGVAPCEISRARKGTIRPAIKIALAENFGWEGGAK